MISGVSLDFRIFCYCFCYPAKKIDNLPLACGGMCVYLSQICQLIVTPHLCIIYISKFESVRLVFWPGLNPSTSCCMNLPGVSLNFVRQYILFLRFQPLELIPLDCILLEYTVLLCRSTLSPLKLNPRSWITLKTC